MNWKKLARDLGLGRAIYRLWHAPRAAVKASIAEGGPIEQWCDRRAHVLMAAAVARLAVQKQPVATEFPEVHFLTGARFWDQTAWCLYTLQAHTGRTMVAVLHDDGTADATVRARLSRLFPQVRWQGVDETVAVLDRALPVARFPALRERWHVYPNLRKLLDVHAGRRGWRLVLDSDMLFFRRPEFLLAWFDRPDRPLHMVDVEDSYGYPRPLLESVAGAPLPPRLNVGLCGLCSEELDWEKLETWCRRLQEAAGTSYYLEQALVAMLCAGRPCAVAPATDYVVLPSLKECQAPRAVLHHYVAGSKRGYYRYAWKEASDRCVVARP